MTHIKTDLPQTGTGDIDIDAWVQSLGVSTSQMPLIRNACLLAQLTGEDQLTVYGANCFLQGLEMAETLAHLQFDAESIAAAILYNTVEYTELPPEDITEQVGHQITQLLQHVQQMDAINRLSQKSSTTQIDNIRKMLLAMVRDSRAIIIKLAERLSLLRAIRDCKPSQQQQAAKETLDIFAPLANRLGLHQIKWELEDIAYSYLKPDEYQEIATQLDERRENRNARIKHFVTAVQKALAVANIKAEVYGRAKHIYSIKRKMQRKNLTLKQIYDIQAIRILVSSVKNCYRTLSIIHELYGPIPNEFDDYITTPKPNGYQSIHTAVMDSNHQNFEIQIRTHKMHQAAEMGVAAHWMYKEGKSQPAYEEKIAWLRQLLEWQKELTSDKELPDVLEKHVFEDRVYVFTPAGDIIDLPTGATPLDFAYHIHTEVGHRCRGAKINEQITSLTQALKTGDRVEILTTKTGGPSRDWLISKRGYLKTSAARAKVLQWFKRQDCDTHLATGKNILEKELQRLGLHQDINLSQIAHQLNFKSIDLMCTALGSGNLRLTHILRHIPSHLIEQVPAVPPEESLIIQAPKTTTDKNITIQGVGSLLTRIAQCCKPVPGDPIVGYITAGHGVTIHHRDCKNLFYTDAAHTDRRVEATWGKTLHKKYPVDIEILAYDRANLIRDVTTTLANHNTNISNLTTHIKNNNVRLHLTIDIDQLETLSNLLDHLDRIPNVQSVRRIQQGKKSGG